MADADPQRLPHAPMKITFLGAAGNVTGSRHLLEVGGKRILVDCGLYQERSLVSRNWDPFPVPPASIHAVVLTHAHIDHCGYLPRLVRDGFHGRVHATQVSAEIARIVLDDSAKLQTEDVAYKEWRHRRENRRAAHPLQPLYTADDARDACQLMVQSRYGEPVTVTEGVTATFLEAGHILGSATVRLEVREDDRKRTIVFSGDLGRRGRPILRDPAPCSPCDLLVLESTYGDRLHDEEGDVGARLAQVIVDTFKRGGNLIIPSFAIERSHDVLYYINTLFREGRIPAVPVFLDSPMAVRVAEVFKRHVEIVDDDTKDLLARHQSPFNFPQLRMTPTVDESKAINNVEGSAIIIAGSGMCTGGRIKHHLVRHISHEKNTILFVGYQAAGTLGRIISSGAKDVRILGKSWNVRARVLQIHGFSAHADRNELLDWIGDVRPRHTFVVHGEPEASAAFRDILAREKGIDASVPKYLEEADLGG